MPRPPIYLLIVLALLAGAWPCFAQDRPDPLGELESWVILEEEEAEDPPFLRLHMGLAAWITTRSQLKVGRGASVPTDMRNLEAEQGLTEEGLGPWIEFSMGGKLRFGADATWVQRFGAFRLQDQPIVFDGVELTDGTPGERVKAELGVATVAALVEWDALYGKTYRIGLIGGLRYFRLEAQLTGRRIVGAQEVQVTARDRGELLSPFFGGLVELTPFPTFSVFTRIQFMNWSWSEVNLKEARFFEFRLGVNVNVIGKTLSFSAEYRFFVIRAQADRGQDEFEGGVAANGLVFSANFSF